MRLTRWDAPCSTQETDAFLLHLACVHAQKAGDSPQAIEIRALLAERSVQKLCTFELDVSQLSDPVEYYHLRQILAFFQKRADLVLDGVSKVDAAWKTFEEAEALCRETNELFRLYSSGGFYFHPRVESVLYVAQRKISTILGDLPSLCDLKLRFGPGATTQVKRRDASARRKLSQAFACSEDSVELLQELLEEMPLWSQAPCEGGPDSISTSVHLHDAKVSFVPKTAKTDRTIAIEPSLTGMVQLAIGDHIAGRLRQVGVDLQDQTLNQRLALKGSRTGALATLDLSSASDTVACGLVESLLPFDWWEFLSKARTHRARTPSGLRRLEKFSTMGNGFTFALESLIFYALAKACAELTSSEGEVSVYGDDIIVPVGANQLLQEVLCACGFKVNRKKSFATGSFRESCGKDYFSGISVRPCYIKAALSPQTLFILHNYYVREGWWEFAPLVLEAIPAHLRLFGPDGFGDGHLLGDFEPRPLNRDLGWGGYTFETFTLKPIRRFYALGGDYVFPCYSIYVSSDAETVLDSFDSLAVKHARRGYLRSRWVRPKKPHGSLRPPGEQTRYQGSLMEDTVTGARGYKRIKIYYHG